MSTLTFWQNRPSIHQAPLMRRLGEKWGTDLTIIAEDDVSEQRKKQGWTRPDYSPASLIISPTSSERKQHLHDRDSASDIHLFSGLHAYPEIYRMFKIGTQTNAQLGVILEAGRPNDGLKVHLRKLRYRLHALRWKRHLNHILAMGRLGEQWYRACGFPDEKIRPFGYFVEDDVSTDSSGDFVSTDLFTISFVGKVIKRKGPDLLVKALSKIQTEDWQLVVIGEGPIEAEVKRIATENDISNRIHWLGTLDSYSDVRSVMAVSDLFVLPSRYDGWGAVVNEALHEGTPVITTETSGAADLIQHETLGSVVPPVDTTALADALKSRIESGPVDQKQREQIEKWADKSISPDVAADYLIDVLESEDCPVPPWRRNKLEA